MKNTPSDTSSTGTTYFVYADYGYVSQREIAKGSDYAKIKRVFEDETSNPTKMDCSVIIELASFAENGEFKVHASQTPEESWDDESEFVESYAETLDY